MVARVMMLQGSKQALAATQFAGLQPADVLGNLGDIRSGFASAFLMIFFSELGDRRFFISVIAYIGGSLFLAFAAITIVEIVT